MTKPVVVSQTSMVPKQWYGDVPRSAKLPTIAGVAALLIAVFGFGGWATNAPIAGAAVAPGNFVATGQNKIIQHLEGGIIREIMVREGDIVRAGQTLVRLDETEPRAELRRMILRQARLRIVEARLRAEGLAQPEMTLPAELLAEAKDADVGSILESERFVFTARRNMLASELKVLEQGINAFREQMSGAEAQLQSVRAQLELIEEELQVKRQLFEQELIRKSDVLILQRAKARLEGEIGHLLAEVGNAKERISRTREEINTTKQRAIQDSVEELRAVEADIHDVREQIRTAEDILDRIDIVAPVAGVVVKLQYHTPGGVIEPGKNILELLPVGDELIIESRVRPQDIDNIKVGQKASVRLTALNRRVTPMVTGEVVYISADTLPDQQTSQLSRNDIYVARVRLDADVAAIVPDFHPTPGMPAEVYIQTTERTFLEYLLKPVYDSMSRAFRES